MSDLTLVTLDFDESVGPAIRSVEGPLTLSASVRSSISCSAFPESAKSIRGRSHVYPFTVHSLYCHCIYVRKNCPVARGYRLFSFVVVSKAGLLDEVLVLLRSLSSILSESYSDILALMLSMFNTWKQLFGRSEKADYLPLFDGIAIDRRSPSSIRLIDVMGVDLQKVWDHLVLGLPVLVLGTTPAKTARVVLELASLVTSFSAVHIVPYIPITDPRFSGLAKSPKGIIGVSNPIAPSLFQADVLTVSVGFERQDRCDCRGCFSRARRCSSELERNTEMLDAAVGEALAAMVKADSLHFRRGEMDLTLIGQKLWEKGVATWSTRSDFVSKLVEAPAFGERYRFVLDCSDRTQKNQCV
jgi:hypothetical protein